MSARDTMDDLLNAMLGGASSDSGEGGGEGDLLADLLGGMMAGGAGDDPAAGGLLEGLIGGASQQGAGGLGDILGAVLGGGDTTTQAGGLLDPIAESLSEKLGLSPEISRAVEGFAFSKLMGALTGAASGTDSATGAQEGLDLDNLLGQMGRGQGLDAEHIKSTGMADELAVQTGLDRDTAAVSLEESFSLLSGQVSGGQLPSERQEPKEGGLDDLLENW